MTKLNINTGISINDGTGDSLFEGATKINNNFDEIYNYFGDGDNLTFIGFSGDYDDLINKPTNLSEFNNDLNLVTDYTQLTNTPTSLSEFINDVGYTTFSGEYGSLLNVPTNVSAFNNDAGYTSYQPVGRVAISTTTEILGVGQTSNVTFLNGLSKYNLLKIGVSHGAWITIYTDSSSMINDENRDISTDPTPNSGVIAQIITSGISSSIQRFTPALIGYNDDNIVSNTIYAKVVNNSGISTEITVTLTISD